MSEMDTASVMVGQFDALLQPVLQAGFAGMAAVLLGTLIWLAKRFLDQSDKAREAQAASDARMAEQMQRTAEVISQNTVAITNLLEATNAQKAELRRMVDELLTRPCMLTVEK